MEGWIQRIKLRVGGEALVIIVATHCKTADLIARIDEARLRRDHGDLDLVFHSVDSKTNDGIEDLKVHIARTAAKLPQMGNQLNPRWKAARDEALALPDSRVPFLLRRHLLAVRPHRPVGGNARCPHGHARLGRLLRRRRRAQK